MLDKLARCIKQERLRLVLKGNGYIVALVFNVVALSIYRHFCETHWEGIRKSTDNPKFHLFFCATQLIIWAVHGLNFLFYGIIDHFNIFYKYKVNKTNLLWDVDPNNWKTLRNKSLYYNFLVIFVIGPILLFIDSFLTKMDFSTDIPSLFQMVTQLYFLMAVEGTFFYIFHRLGHEYLYEYHKLHHQFSVPCPLATNHTHPVDYIGTALPFALGVIALQHRIHYLTFILWAVWRISQGYDGHSNYDFPWSPFRIIPFAGSGDYHSFHHTHNIGNYGSLTYFQDTLTNMNVEYDRFVKSRLEKPKKLKSTKETNLTIAHLLQ